MVRGGGIDRQILARDAAGEVAEKVVAVVGPTGTPYVSIGMQADFPGSNSSKTHGLSLVFEIRCQCNPRRILVDFPTSQPFPKHDHRPFDIRKDRCRVSALSHYVL